MFAGETYFIGIGFLTKNNHLLVYGIYNVNASFIQKIVKPKKYTVMDTVHTSTENFNDMVFENRNKAYGAYAIRKSYNDNLSFAILSSVSSIGIIALAIFLFSKNNDNGPDLKGQLALQDSVSIFVDITPIPKPEVKIEKIVPQKDLILKSDNLNLVASDNKKDILEKANTDAVIIKDGKPDGADSVPVIIDLKMPDPVPLPSNDPVLFADEMPEFKGNMFKYIKDNLNYPWAAKENSTSGMVVIQFVVEYDGSIGNLKVLHSVGDGCTEEAMRVVKSMPKWKPGKNHGAPARVLFNLPIKFTIK